MNSLQIPKPVGIAIAVAFALLIGGGLWYRFTPQQISAEFMAKDAQRQQREEGDAEKLREGRSTDDRARAEFHSDKSYQAESDSR